MRVVIASQNPNKIRECKSIMSEVDSFFSGVEFLSLAELGIYEDVEENGQTFAENAKIKARAAAKHCSDIVLADDSGLAVDALGGAPGVYSARYGGEHGNDAANNARLLRELASVARSERTAHFCCTIACVLPDGRELLSEGRCDGLILDAPRGKGGFGYDPLFYLPERGMTMAEMAPQEKNAVSHRARALKSMAEMLRPILEEQYADK